MNGRIGIVLTCLTIAAYANQTKDCQPLLAKKCDNQPIREWVGEQQVSVCSYDCDLFSRDKKVLFVNVEFLYWTVTEGALDYAIKMKKAAWGNPTDAVGHYQRAEFDWRPGLRVSFGYFNAPHYWDAYAQYTYFHATGHEKVKKPHNPTRFLNGTWPQPDPSGDVPLSHASSSIGLTMNLLDLLATRRFHPNPHLRIRANGGIAIGLLRQNWEINYRDTNWNKSHLHNNWHFGGAGIQFGGIVDWFMGKGGYYLTAGSSLSFLAGSYKNVTKQKSTFSGPGFDPSLPLRNAHYQDTRLIPHFRIYAGPSWQQSFTRFRTEVQLAYELNIWANLHEVIRTSSDAPTAPKLTSLDSAWIGIQGVTVRWNLDF